MSSAERITDLLREHTAATTRYVAALSRRMGIGASELTALEHLQAAGPMTLGRLGERLSMSPGAVTALVDRLERRGHAERIPNPEDRRSALVRQTRAGLEETFGQLRPYVQDMAKIEEGLSGEERAAVARFLSAATEVAHRHAEEMRRG